jgi:HAD-superfamily hydrolase, subfamily IIB
LKAVFFDADGTLCDVVKGITSKTIEAVNLLQSNGHMAFLCTARPRSFITPELERIGFDGMITSCGAYVTRKEVTDVKYELECEQAFRALCTLRENRFAVLMEGIENVYLDKDEYNMSVDDKIDTVINQISGLLPILGNERLMRINKITARPLRQCNIEKAFFELSDIFDVIRHEDNAVLIEAELVPKGFSKATGINVICEKLSIRRENTIAFGDSSNDISMFEAVGFGVAMGNAPESLKKLAGYITTDFDRDGVYFGLKHLRLI